MRWTSVMLGLLLCGCYTGSDPANADTEPGASEDTETGEGDTSDPDVPDAPGVEAKERPLQHLTRAQYEATVADLWPGAPAGIAGEVEVVDPQTGATRVLGALDADDVQQGFELGTAMSSFLPEKFFDRAELLAAALVQDFETVLPCAETSPDDACAETFVSTFGLRAFRRPPTAEETDDLLALHDEVAEVHDFETGVEAMAFAMLTSPAFLYHLENSAHDGGDASEYELASRLSYFVIGSMPDAELFDAAAAGELSSPDGLGTQAERLLDSPRAADGLYNFLRQWLVLDAIESLQKDMNDHPDFDSALGPELRRSLELQLRGLADDPQTVVADLLLDEDFYVNERLANFYATQRDSDDADVFVPTVSPHRLGVLSHPGVLALNSKLEETQLVARGLFVRERLLCLPIPLPPEDVPLEIPEVDPDDPPENMRERFERHVEIPSCAGCHVFIDPPGFALEGYDGLGRHRLEDIYGPVDTSGELSGVGDVDGSFSGFEEFNRMLAESEIVAGCVAERMFEISIGRPVDPDDESDAVELAFLREQSATTGGSLRGIARAIAATVSFRAKPQP
ncbi:MAG: DUF1592 domain-containing protein [Nannocystaceae bacterium]|nr:DUF1592 domain-containing protein [Nannocystaceae bacterium]